MINIEICNDRIFWAFFIGIIAGIVLTAIVKLLWLGLTDWLIFIRTESVKKAINEIPDK